MASATKKTMRKGGPEKCPGGACSECIGGPHHFNEAITEDEITMPGHEAIAMGVEVWYQCLHCDGWQEYDLDSPPSDTAEPAAIMSAARLDEAFKRIEACTSFVEVSEELAMVRAHLDALTPRAPVDGEALGFALFIGDMRETDNRATREAWAQMDPDPKAEYVSRALDLHAIGYAAGRNEGEAERAALAAELAKRDAEIEGLRCELAKRDALTAEARAALTPRAPSTREQRVERLGKIARELLQIGEDTVSEYLARDAEIARLTAELAEARAAVDHARMDVKMTSELRKMAEHDASVARIDGARGANAQLADVAEIAASLRWTRANSDNPGDQAVYVDRLLALFPEQSAAEGRQG